jgi:hypothetical protein
MINIFGKGLVFIQVGLSIVLMTVALALYLNAVDLGWDKPARYWREVKGKKGENLLEPSLFDKREAAFRKVVRVTRDELIRLNTIQENHAKFGMILADNRLKGEEVLDKLQKGEGKIDVLDIAIDAQGALKRQPQVGLPLGFPMLETKVPNVNLSYAGYLAKLKEVDDRIAAVQENTGELLKKEKALSARLTGELGEDGKPVVDRTTGSVKQPGWYYLLEAQSKTQKELLKEMDYLQPILVNTLVDASLVLSRRDSLLGRLRELAAKGADTKDIDTQSQFSKKKLEKSK